MSKRFLATLTTFILIGVVSGGAILLAKGYRFTPGTQTVVGTGILSITSLPEQASVYLDGELRSATNTNINSLAPKEYELKILKDGFIPWQKQIVVREGLVTDVKATLFSAIPSIYPMTFNGVNSVTTSNDNQRLAFVVPNGLETVIVPGPKKAGIWIWDMVDRAVVFVRGREPHQVYIDLGQVDLNAATLRFSPDSNQLMVTIGDRHYTLDTNKMNSTLQDITAIAQPTLNDWDTALIADEQTRLNSIKDIKIKNTASSSAVLKWSPDETKFLFSVDGKQDFKVADIKENLVYDLPPADRYQWLGTSNHVVLTEIESNKATPAPTKKPSSTPDPTTSLSALKQTQVSIVEYDGGNKSIIYAAMVDPEKIISWPDGSRLVIVSSINTPTASKPNLYGISLK